MNRAERAAVSCPRAGRSRRCSQRLPVTGRPRRSGTAYWGNRVRPERTRCAEGMQLRPAPPAGATIEIDSRHGHGRSRRALCGASACERDIICLLGGGGLTGQELLLPQVLEPRPTDELVVDLRLGLARSDGLRSPRRLSPRHIASTRTLPSRSGSAPCASRCHRSGARREARVRRGRPVALLDVHFPASNAPFVAAIGSPRSVNDLQAGV